MRPLSAEDPFVVELAVAVAEARARIDVAGCPPPSADELAVLCNTALRLCVARYEGEPLFTTLMLFGADDEPRSPAFMHFVAGPDWRALARGFPEGVATRVLGSELRPFAGLTVPLAETSAASLPVARALVLPGVVGVTMGGELLAELRPGLTFDVLAHPRPSFESLLARAGLPDDALLRPTHLRRLLRAARQHRHGASLIVTSSPRGVPPQAPPLAGALVQWDALHDALLSTGEHSPEGGRLADALGRLTAVDGAIVLSHAGTVSGFGLRLSAAANPAVTVQYSDRLGEAPSTRELLPSTGSRRRSAVDYVTAHPDCFALVLSSDGPLSLTARRDERTVVVQRGLECLL
ncbi:MAG: hypothetical protein ACOZQL_08645 [Myxococcota bacterium]